MFGALLRSCKATANQIAADNFKVRMKENVRGFEVKVSDFSDDLVIYSIYIFKNIFYVFFLYSWL